MRLHRLKLNNWRQHASSEITFPADGIIGLVGPNEGGKSTVLECVAWCLFGTRATRGTKDSIRWKGAPDRQIAHATLTFEVGGTTYVVHRTENDASLKEKGATQLIAEGITAVDNRIPRLLGMDLDEFEATYLARQKDLDRLEEMGGVDKRRFVLGLMGMGRIDEAIEACRDRKNELKNEIRGLREGLGEREPLETERKLAAQAIEDLSTRIEETFEPAVREARDTGQAVREAVEEARERRERHTELTRQLTEAKKGRQEAAREVDRVSTKLEEARAAKAEFEDRRHEVADLPDRRQERDELREARARAKERRTLESMVSTKEEAVERLETKLEAAVAEVERLMEPDPRKLLTERKAKLEDAREELDRLSDNDKVAALRSRLEPGHECPVCSQTVTDVPDASEAQQAVEAARERVGEARSGLEEAREAVDKLEAAEVERNRIQERLRSEREALEEARENLSDTEVPAFDATRLAQIEGEIERMEAAEVELTQLKGRAERIPELAEEHERWSKKAKAAEQRIDDTSEALSGLDFDADRYERLEERMEQARETYQEASERLSKAETRLEAARERHERATEQLEAWDDRAEVLGEKEEDHQVHVETDERLAAFRQAEASSIRPELEDLMSGFLSVLTDGRHEAVRLTEDFEVRVQETGGEMEVVSGGAQDVVAIAMRLAISQLIAERAGHPLSLLVLDEPFGSLDAVRRQNVLQLIRRLKGVFQQVVLISHIEEIQDAVDHAYRIEHDEAEGKSRILREAPSAASEVAA